MDQMNNGRTENMEQNIGSPTVQQERAIPFEANTRTTAGTEAGNERADSIQGSQTTKPLRGEYMHIDFDEFEMTRAELFGDSKVPVFTVNERVVGANAICVRQLWDVDYMEFAICHKRKLLLLVPCDESVIQGYRWAREKDGKRYATTRTGIPFVLSICQMMGWDPSQRHRIPGRLVNNGGIEVMAFDLAAAKHFDKPSGQKGSKSQVIFTGDWDGHFGPKFSEGRRTLQVDKFDELTVWSIKEGDTEQAYVLPENKGATVEQGKESDAGGSMEQITMEGIGHGPGDNPAAASVSGHMEMDGETE